MPPIEVLICINERVGANVSCAGRGGGAKLADALEKAAQDAGLELVIARGPCLGYCTDGPNIRIVGDRLFHNITEKSLPALIAYLRSISQ